LRFPDVQTSTFFKTKLNETAMYPPPLHTERDAKKLYAVMEAYPLATVISATDEQIYTTPLPLMLDPKLGEQGTLIGHLDRSNPQAEFLDNQPVKVIFHGPDGYISPHVYTSSQLPTWNYIQVHVNGRARWMAEAQELYDSLVTMTERMEPDSSAKVLEPHEDRIQELMNYLVGFDIEIQEMVGRFKLSQNREPEDMKRAKRDLIEQNQIGYEHLLDLLLD
jgi:transcriptional regulator